MTQPIEFTTADLCSGNWPPPREITAPEAGEYILNHQPGFIEMWNVGGDEPELTDAALLEDPAESG